jgi:pimeloyl-ACP methyl ester carboxylesterase
MRRHMKALIVAAALINTGCLAIPTHAKTGARPFSQRLLEMTYEWVEVPIDDETVLRGIWVPADGPPLLLLPGSGMGISRNDKLIRILHDGGYSVLNCDYRGTGYSSGRWMTSRYLDDDARALWEWLRANKGEPAGVIGVSMGAVAAASLLNHPHPPQAVVLDRPVNPHTVIWRWLGQYSKIAGLVSLLCVRTSVDFDFVKSFENPDTDVLVVLPQNDMLLPARDVRHLRKHFGERVRTVTMPGGHLSSHLIDPAGWRAAFLDFFDERLRPGQPPRGRAVTPDAAKVVRWSWSGSRLRVELDRDRKELPDGVRVIAMGKRFNIMIDVWPPTRVMELEVERKWARRLRPLFGVRVVTTEFPRPVGTRWRHEVGTPPAPAK